MSRFAGQWRGIVVALAAALLAPGCRTFGTGSPQQGPVEVVSPSQLPSELKKVSLPPYTIAPPDVLLIEAQRLIPLPPYRVNPLDVLYVFAVGAPEREPINGLYPVDSEGAIALGNTYGGTVSVADLTVPEIEKAVGVHLKRFLSDSTVVVTLAQSRGVQPIKGEHIVRPDGTVGLGTYGNVHLAGMTLPQAKAAIEQQLSQKLLKPEVSVDVAAYNSMFYYVVTDFAGSGEQVARLPCTGGETVLDAIALIGGLSAVSSKTIWIARPAPDGVGDQVLPVDWKGITRRGQTGTNYQVLPGDRIFVMSQPVTKFDTVLGRIAAPVERVLGVSLLGYTTIRTMLTGSEFGGNGAGL